MTTCHAQLPKVDDSRLGVDVVKLVDGKRLYGFVLSENADRSLRFAVERKWLESTYPDFYEERIATESQEIQLAREELLKRVDLWIKEREKDGLLVRFLNSERTRIQDGRVDEQHDWLFMAMEIPRNTVRNVTVQKADQRKIAGLAYGHDIENVATTPATLLLRLLEELDVDPENEQVDLSDDVPNLGRQSPRQWAGRKALIEFHFRKPLEYQGTGSMLMSKGDAGADANALIGQLLGGVGMEAVSQLGAELGLPEFQQKKEAESDWWSDVTRKAEEDGFIGVLVTRMKQSMLSPEVVVETSFFAMESPGRWFSVVEFRSTADANKQSSERIARLKEDPQIKAVVDSMASFGLAAGDRLDQALRHGAATEQAMQDASSQFNTYLSKHIESLDR